ncbi:MAG TPA: XdhC family protein [Pirellulales bacterium]|jgi:xanthine dehydrogenase accessory factor|nr:XdhC family protein [Pirellulales bacterium]
MAVPHEFVEKLAELSSAGRPFAAVTLVETVGSTPSDAGTKMLIDTSGLVFGTVGGGKVESKAIGHAQELLNHAANGSPTCALVEWNLQRDVGMTCGGVVKLLFEAYNFHEWRIVVFGAGHVAQALVRLLLLLECRLICIDQREEWLAKLPHSPKLRTVLLPEPRDFVSELRPEDYVICMTMGHKTDRPILQAILERNLPRPLGEGRREGAAILSQNFQLPYLGVIGSQAKRKVLVRELIEAGMAKDLAEQFRCPIGLPLGTNQPGEIAVSIAAEFIQCRDAVPKS